MAPVAQAHPTPAVTQTLAAVVSPCTSFWSARFRITPPPRKPIPPAIPWKIRDSSTGVIPDSRPPRMKRAEPSETSMCVLNPAMLWTFSRCQPITPPRRAATRSRTTHGAKWTSGGHLKSASNIRRGNVSPVP